MLSANYPYRSTTTRVVQDQTAASQGVANVYDATVTITGLRPNTTYHWRPLARDASGNMAAYRDRAFATMANELVTKPVGMGSSCETVLDGL